MPPQPYSPPGVPLAWGLLLLLPVLMVITGTVLGFRALRDIRLAGGTLGGPMIATLAAGLLPAVLIVAMCGFGMGLFAEFMRPNPSPRNDGLMHDPDAWGLAGAMVGAWTSFLMLRGMHRRATGWVNPVTGDQDGVRSGLSTTAIVLTIVGTAGALFVMGTMRRLSHGAAEKILIVDLVILVAGTVCGVLTRHEPAGKPCAWICGLLFVWLVLLTAS